jgi:hypothetical protein
VGRGSRVVGRGSRVVGRGSRVEGRGSRVEGVVEVEGVIQISIKYRSSSYMVDLDLLLRSPEVIGLLLVSR